MLISIIIPLYNRKDLIIETIKSLQTQTYTYWEAIIVDDGSTDGSYEIVEKLLGSDSRLKLYRRNMDVKGASTCRNIGINEAEGDWLIFLDSDDILSPSCLKGRIEKIAKSGEHDFYVFQGAFFNEAIEDSKYFINLFTSEDDLNRFLRIDNPWLICSCVWKRKSLLHNHYFDASVSTWQDWEFHVKALIKDFKYIKFNDAPDCFVRVHLGERISNGLKDTMIQDRLKIFKEIYELLKLKNKISFSRTNYLGSAILHTALLYLNLENNIEKSLLVWKNVKDWRMISPINYKLIYLYLLIYKRFRLRERTRIRKYVLVFYSTIIPDDLIFRRIWFRKQEI